MNKKSHKSICMPQKDIPSSWMSHVYSYISYVFVKPSGLDGAFTEVGGMPSDWEPRFLPRTKEYVTNIARTSFSFMSVIFKLWALVSLSLLLR